LRTIIFVPLYRRDRDRPDRDQHTHPFPSDSIVVQGTYRQRREKKSEAQLLVGGEIQLEKGAMLVEENHGG